MKELKIKTKNSLYFLDFIEINHPIVSEINQHGNNSEG